MSFFQSIILAIVQGLTEFLPVSSSGHLVIFQKIFSISEPPIAFDTVVHFGTMVSVLFFFRKEIKKIFADLISEIKRKKIGQATHLLILLAIASVPIVIVGLLLEKKIEVIFNSLSLVGFSFLITAFILFLTGVVRKKEKDIRKTKIGDAIFIGLFQALAILPGVSRSGSTISAGLFRGIKKEDAFKFSFFLGVVAIFGAMVLQIPKISILNSAEAVNAVLGFVFATIFGVISIKILKPIVIKGRFYYFGIYCLILGIACLIIELI